MSTTLKQAIDTLADCKTVEEVRNRIVKAGVKLRECEIEDCCRCPVARYLSKLTSKAVSVGTSSTWLSDGPSASRSLPRIVNLFIYRWDSGSIAAQR